jgi:cytochrome d ubiquinol oxidase subunit I
MAYHVVWGALMVTAALFDFWGSQLFIAMLFLTHIMIAALLTGLNFIAVAMESTYYFTKDRRWDRAAHGIAKLQVIMFAPGSLIAITAVMALGLLWPVFWDDMMRIAFWPMIIEAISFILWILYLYTWYFTWEALADFPALHISVGYLLMFVSWSQQFSIDIVASYMLTPTSPLSLHSILFNPTMFPLDVHRTIGNISYAGFALAGFSGWRYLTSRKLEEKAYWDWLGSLGVLFGVGFMFMQPFVGYQYVLSIRDSSFGAFYHIMGGGQRSWLFLIQVAILGVLFFMSGLYAIAQMVKSRSPNTWATGVLLGLVVFFAVWLMLPPHWTPSIAGLPLDFMGQLGMMNPWKYWALAGLTLSGLFLFMNYLGAVQIGFKWGARGIVSHLVTIALGLVIVAMMFTMGLIREEARRPYLIYGRMYIEPQGWQLAPSNSSPSPPRQIVPIPGPNTP